jgi:hypothetical protein
MELLTDLQVIMLNRRAAFDVISYQARRFADDVRGTLRQASQQ